MLTRGTQAEINASSELLVHSSLAVSVQAYGATVQKL